MYTPATNTSKIIGSIDREVRSLVSHIDAGTTHLASRHPDAGLIVRRVPERMVVQSPDAGVSLSFFRSRAGMDAAAEVVLSVWKGEVTFPGCTPRADRHATQLSERQFHITRGVDEESWLWTDKTTSNTMTSEALAEACVDTVAKQLLVSDEAVVTVGTEAQA